MYRDIQYVVWKILLGIDIVFNFTIGSLLFLRRPYEKYFTTRLNKMRVSPAPWRKRLATKICTMLDLTDLHHCNNHYIGKT